jgi:tetratricopeptide (TPR) repeat protein
VFVARTIISYRREDSSGYAGRLYDALAENFGQDQVFMDIHTIGPGVDFVDAIEEAISSCRVLIVLMGPRWLDMQDAKGRRRLDVLEDFVRLEVVTALEHRVHVLPVLVGGSAMPGSEDLPEALTKLARLNALELSDSRWAFDVGKLTETLERLGMEPRAKQRMVEPSLPRSESLLELVPKPPLFVGRDQELSDYPKLLKSTNIVIIKGIAGVGKTSLGAKLARTAAPEKDIFWFTFDQVEKNTADALFWALAAFFESRGQPQLWQYLQGEVASQQPLDRTVKLNLFLSALATGDYVLCFDDLHLVGENTDITQLFKTIQDRFWGNRQTFPARLILMGREMPREIGYPGTSPLLGFTEAGAQALLTAHGAELPSQLLELVWQRTEGNPKLTELAASALSRLGSDRAAMEKFVTSMAGKRDIRDYVMTHIYAALTPEEQRVVSALSIFPTPVGWDMAKDMLAAEGVRGAVSCIDALVNKSVLSETEDDAISCHGLVRDFCYRNLDRQDQMRFHQWAAEYYEEDRNILAASYHHFIRGDEARALDLLTTNTRALINAGGAGALLEQLTRFDTRHLTLGQKLALNQARGDAHTVRGEYQQALEVYRAALKDAPTEKDRAALLHTIGLVYRRLWEYPQAIQHLHQALAISSRVGDQVGIAQSHTQLGWANHQSGQLEQASEHFALGLNLAKSLEDRTLLGLVIHGLGQIDMSEGKLDEARVRLEESRHIFHTTDDPVREARVTADLGWTYYWMGDSECAFALIRDVAQVLEKIGDVDGLSIQYNNLGHLHHQLGKHQEAIHYYERLANLASNLQNKPLLSTACAGMADAYLALGNMQRAREYAQDAYRIAQGSNSAVDQGVSLRILGEVALALGEPVQAKTSFEESILLLEEAKEDQELARARHGHEVAVSQLNPRDAVREGNHP